MKKVNRVIHKWLIFNTKVWTICKQYRMQELMQDGPCYSRQDQEEKNRC